MPQIKSFEASTRIQNTKKVKKKTIKIIMKKGNIREH